MNMRYHPGKSNIVVNTLNILSMCSLGHNDEEKKELAKDVHWLARFRVQIMDSTLEGIVVTNRDESSLVSKVKEKQDQDPILLGLKANVHNQRVLDFE